MTNEQWLIIAVLVATMGLFLWGRWRHDVVALISLLVCVLIGLVPTSQAFLGFGHPAVVTVACVLVLSRGLLNSGVVDILTQRLIPQSSGTVVTIAALSCLAAVLSAFMNNVGALALLMPIAIQIATKQGVAPGRLLMPLSFASILGGMTTLIGTPPNLIVAGFRAQSGGDSFSMFDFSGVGASVAIVGVLFIILVGWRLVPERKRLDAEGFDTGAYLTEIRVTEKSKAADKALGEIEAVMEDAGAQIVALIRNNVRVAAPSTRRKARAGDILVVEAEPEGLASTLASLELTLEEAAENQEDEEKDKEDKGDADSSTADLDLAEYAVSPTSSLIGRSAAKIHLRRRYGVNLLAVSRQGQRSVARLRGMSIQAGDVLLMQGVPEALAEFSSDFGCIPLAERSLRLPSKRQGLFAVLIMAAAIVATAFGLVSAAVAFVLGVVAATLTNVVPVRRVYEAVDWPVVVLLGALIPVAGAMQATGAADVIARAMLTFVAQGNAVVGLGLILIVTMTLSDFMNNAATAAVMSPVAIRAASQLDVNPDAFLMAVAVGASCAFLTPIGHQNNTLILGSGGFRFGDYWKLGLPVELIVIGVGIPMILFVWPL
ncbi:SLC13 family permease [Aestuariispira ectoiniformans]|uniref:SLC13 family permease n=1 Tax=Aestuariispira ectoiniformans TaxID=2775080 RepID=UPI00223C52E3|nr:SLC13 family permease [Aestuariispira ectoiniformans]